MTWINDDNGVIRESDGNVIGEAASYGNAKVIVAAHNQLLDKLRVLVDQLGSVPVESRAIGFMVKDGEQMKLFELSEADSQRYHLWEALTEALQ